MANEYRQLGTPRYQVQQQVGGLSGQAPQDLGAQAFLRGFAGLSQSISSAQQVANKQNIEKALAEGDALQAASQKNYKDAVKDGDIDPMQNPWVAVGAMKRDGDKQATALIREARNEWKAIANDPNDSRGTEPDGFTKFFEAKRQTVIDASGTQSHYWEGAFHNKANTYFEEVVDKETSLAHRRALARRTDADVESIAAAIVDITNAADDDEIKDIIGGVQTTIDALADGALWTPEFQDAILSGIKGLLTSPTHAKSANTLLQSILTGPKSTDPATPRTTKWADTKKVKAFLGDGVDDDRKAAELSHTKAQLIEYSGKLGDLKLALVNLDTAVLNGTMSFDEANTKRKTQAQEIVDYYLTLGPTYSREMLSFVKSQLEQDKKYAEMQANQFAINSAFTSVTTGGSYLSATSSLTTAQRNSLDPQFMAEIQQRVAKKLSQGVQANVVDELILFHASSGHVPRQYKWMLAQQMRSFVTSTPDTIDDVDPNFVQAAETYKRMRQGGVGDFGSADPAYVLLEEVHQALESEPSKSPDKVLFEILQAGGTEKYKNLQAQRDSVLPEFIADSVNGLFSEEGLSEDTMIRLNNAATQKHDELRTRYGPEEAAEKLNEFLEGIERNENDLNLSNVAFTSEGESLEDFAQHVGKMHNEVQLELLEQKFSGAGIDLDHLLIMNDYSTPSSLNMLGSMGANIEDLFKFGEDDRLQHRLDTDVPYKVFRPKTTFLGDLKGAAGNILGVSYDEPVSFKGLFKREPDAILEYAEALGIDVAIDAPVDDAGARAASVVLNEDGSISTIDQNGYLHIIADHRATEIIKNYRGDVKNKRYEKLANSDLAHDALNQDRTRRDSWFPADITKEEAGVIRAWSDSVGGYISDVVSPLGKALAERDYSGIPSAVLDAYIASSPFSLDFGGRFKNLARGFQVTHARGTMALQELAQGAFGE